MKQALLAILTASAICLTLGGCSTWDPQVDVHPYVKEDFYPIDWHPYVEKESDYVKFHPYAEKDFGGVLDWHPYVKKDFHQ